MTDQPIDLSSRRPAPEPKPEELILCCDCGCRTFYVVTTGVLECSACNETLTDDLTGYDPAEVKKVAPPKEPHDRHSMPTQELALRRVAGAAKIGDTVAVVVMNKNGVTHTWSEGAERAGHDCVKSDLVDRGCGAEVSNFYDYTSPLAPALVTNPPFCEANWKDGKGRWITHALEVLKVDYMALLLPWTWMGAQGLGIVLDRHPPKRVYLMRFRLDFTGAGSPPTYCGWYVWERGYQGRMELLMMDRADPLQVGVDL